MITNKIRSVDDSVCNGCPQNWEEECRAFQMPHTEAERIHRSIPYPITNCAVPSPLSRVKPFVLEDHTPTEDECMTIGMLHGAGNSYGNIVEILVERGWDRDYAVLVTKYVANLTDQIGLPG